MSKKFFVFLGGLTLVLALVIVGQTVSATTTTSTSSSTDSEIASTTTLVKEELSALRNQLLLLYQRLKTMLASKQAQSLGSNTGNRSGSGGRSGSSPSSSRSRTPSSSRSPYNNPSNTRQMPVAPQGQSLLSGFKYPGTQPVLPPASSQTLPGNTNQTVDPNNTDPSNTDQSVASSDTENVGKMQLPATIVERVENCKILSGSITVKGEKKDLAGKTAIWFQLQKRNLSVTALLGRLKNFILATVGVADNSALPAREGTVANSFWEGENAGQALYVPGVSYYRLNWKDADKSTFAKDGGFKDGAVEYKLAEDLKTVASPKGLESSTSEINNGTKLPEFTEKTKVTFGILDSEVIISCATNKFNESFSLSDPSSNNPIVQHKGKVLEFIATEKSYKQLDKDWEEYKGEQAGKPAEPSAPAGQTAPSQPSDPKAGLTNLSLGQKAMAKEGVIDDLNDLGIPLEKVSNVEMIAPSENGGYSQAYTISGSGPELQSYYGQLSAYKYMGKYRISSYDRSLGKITFYGR